MTISKGQFKGLAAGANAGGSSSFVQQGVEDVKDRYMVGGVAPGVSHDAPISPRAIASYTRANKNLLISRSDMALGTWLDKDRTPKPQVDLDVSQSYPRTASGRRDSFGATLQRNEMALGELDKTGDFTQHDNPFSTRRNLPDRRKVLRSNPAAYEAVVSGKVLGGMASWIKG